MSNPRPFGTTQKLPSGRIQARYIGPDKKRHTLGTYDTKLRAQIALAEIQEQITNGTWRSHTTNTTNQQTLGQWVTHWLQLIEHTHKPNTVQSHTAVLNRCLFNAPGEAHNLQYTPLHLVTKRDIITWWDALNHERGNINDNYAGYKRLKTALNAAMERELITANPCTLKEAGKRPIPKRKELPTNHDMLTVLDTIDDRYKLLTTLTLFHGLRIGEALALRRKDIEPTPNGWIIHVRGSAYRKLGHGMIRQNTPKTNAGNRDVPIFPRFNHIIENHMATYPGPNPDDPINITASGKTIMDTSYRSILTRTKNAAGITADFTPHSGRVWLITNLIEAGMTIPAIGEILGQRDLKTITETYMRTTDARKTDALNKINNLLQ